MTLNQPVSRTEHGEASKPDICIAAPSTGTFAPRTRTEVTLSPSVVTAGTEGSEAPVGSEGPAGSADGGLSAVPGFSSGSGPPAGATVKVKTASSVTVPSAFRLYMTDSASLTASPAVQTTCTAGEPSDASAHARPAGVER